MCWLAVQHSNKQRSQTQVSDNSSSLVQDDLLEVLIEHRYYKKLIKAIQEHPHKAEMAFLHSSMIVRGGNILALGINLPSQNGFCRAYADYDQTQLHAEFHAVGKVRNKIDLKGCSIYNCRMRRDGTLAMSKPCPSCEAMLKSYGFKKAIYTTDRSIEMMKIGR